MSESVIYGVIILCQSVRAEICTAPMYQAALKPREEAAAWQPQGDRVGWVDGDSVYLDPDASYRTAQLMAGASGESISVTPRTLHKRLKERGLLVSCESQQRRLTCRQYLEGTRRRVLHLHTSTFAALEPVPAVPLDPQPPSEGNNWDSGPLNGYSTAMDATAIGPESGPEEEVLRF